MPDLLGAAQLVVLRLGTAGERVDEIRRGRVDVPLDDRAALHVHEHRAGVPAEDVLVVAVDVVVARLARGDATLGQDPLRLEQRRVRVGAQMREVDAAEDAVPVHVVALRAPEVLLSLAHFHRRIEDAAARELLGHDEHPLVERVRLGVLREEVAPERRGHERLEILAELVPRLLQAARGRRVECPCAHLRIRAARDVDAARGLLEDPRVLERRGLDEVGLRERGEELLEPAVLVHALVRAGPRAELLAVIRIHDEARACGVPLAQLLDRRAHLAERDEVAQLHAPGEHDHRKSLVLGDVRLAGLVLLQTRAEEVLVVEDGVGDAGFSEQRRKMRLPHALGQPRAEGPLPEDRVHAVGERADLTDAVAARHTDEHRLVVATGEELDLTAPHEVGKVADDVGPIGLEPVQERSGEMEARLHFGMAI